MKTVLITGASRGIGRATAIRFAKEGFNVAVNFKENEAAASEICEEIKKNGGSAKAYRADVSQNDEVKAMINFIREDFGEIDVLVNNAGIALQQGLFTDFSEKEFRSVFETNVFGVANCCRAVVPDMVRRHEGKIINVASVWGVCGASCEAIYSASKAAVIGFTKALAKELAPSGINVNAVAPGMIETDMNAHLSKEDVDAFKDEIPLMRAGKPCEVADVIYFLASDEAGYITGQTISVDGGIA